MSAAEVARTWIEAVNRGDMAAFAMLYAPNAVLRDPLYPQPLEGRDAIQKDLSDFLQAFPDLHATLWSTVESGDRYASEGTFTGTHQGPVFTPSGEIPPTGKRIEFAGANFCRLDAQGRILEENRYYDLAGLLAQLEVVVEQARP